MQEIGSEFWKEDDQCKVRIKLDENDVVLLSGRTALDFIIKDIMTYSVFKTVLLPSYCCESMIIPFLKNHVKVEFYDINLLGSDFDRVDYDVILLIDFFGFVRNQTIELARKAKKLSKIIIYDATHKIDGNCVLSEYIDYQFCSYRKWFYCNFAVASKFGNQFCVDYPRLYFDDYLSLRESAALMKRNYMEGKKVEKNIFLDMYKQSEQLLNNDYQNYLGVITVYDVEAMLKKRRRNASFLIENLKDLPGIRFFKDYVADNDSPLFVPILMNNEKRDSLQSYLIRNNVYCPVHWPISSYHSISGNMRKIYEDELSLVCDQRYEIHDMKRLVVLIRNYIVGV